jgi:hypothetical protein
MARRSVSNEIQIAALSAAIEIVAYPDYTRDWLKTEFAERHINAVQATGDNVSAVEEAMMERLNRLAKILRAELDEALTSNESDEESEFAGADIEIVDFIGLAHDESKVSPSVGGYPAGSKIARAEQAAKTAAAPEFFDNFHAKSRKFVTRAIETVMDEERTKGNEVSEDEASAILQKRLTVGLE